MKIYRFILIALSLYANAIQSQDTLRNTKGSEYLFTFKKKIEHLPVEDQCQTGTCWSFSALSFFESEVKRLGKKPVNLSEMYVVRKAYPDKAQQFLRMYGKFNFGPGGAFHDIPYVIKKYGIVPQEIYSGLNYGTEKHIHSELDQVLEAMVKALASNPNHHLSDAWRPAIEAVLDAYLGKDPVEFTYNGKQYTPKSFAKELGLNMDDYVSLTSFTHHPFYRQMIIEVPDNWLMGTSYNLPLDELIQTMKHAILNGYTFAWAADVSEKGFSFKNGLAIVPEDESTIQVKGRDSHLFNNAGAEKKSNAFLQPVKEKTITQEMRQKAFDNLTTTDDHGMHVVGLATDQNGKEYFFVKNSWGESNDLKGYFFASEAYVRYKTINIFLHKDAIPKEIRKKLNIQ